MEVRVKLFRAVLFFMATLLIYLGVPLLGWGPESLTEFFIHRGILPVSILDWIAGHGIFPGFITLPHQG